MSINILVTLCLHDLDDQAVSRCGPRCLALNLELEGTERSSAFSAARKLHDIALHERTILPITAQCMG
jgi:hypothetical protein